MDTLQEQLSDLEATITEQEQTCVRLEADIAELREELEPFEAEYKQIVQPVADRVEAMHEAIRDYEAIQRKTLIYQEDSNEKIWEAVKRASETKTKYTPPSEMPPKSEPPKPLKKPKAGESLKQLYRRLARLFHPDLATDDADREHRTHLMSLINDAYASRDHEALLAVDQEVAMDDDRQTSRPEIPLIMMKIRQLQQKSGILFNRIHDLRLEHQDLLYSDLMELKIQHTLAKANGQDLLQEIADDLEQEYWTLMKRFDKLRNGTT